MTKSILVVEDDPVICQLISWRLKKLGYEVSGTAQTAEEAISRIRSGVPDLILIDIVLEGGVDGTALGSQVRREFGIPFIYLTAHSDDETLSRAIDTGPSGFLLKPFKDEELKVAIEVALKQVPGV